MLCNFSALLLQRPLKFLMLTCSKCRVVLGLLAKALDGAGAEATHEAPIEEEPKDPNSEEVVLEAPAAEGSDAAEGEEEEGGEGDTLVEDVE